MWRRLAAADNRARLDAQLGVFLVGDVRLLLVDVRVAAAIQDDFDGLEAGLFR